MGRALPFLIRFHVATRTALYADKLRRYIGLRGLARQADADEEDPHQSGDFFHGHIPGRESGWGESLDFIPQTKYHLLWQASRKN